MSKGALGYLPPFTLLFVQLSTSVAVLWTAVLVSGARPPLDMEARRAALAGVLEPGLAYAAGTSGLLLTGASHASLISATEPLLVVAIAWALFRARAQRATLTAILVTVPGVALVTLSDPAGARNSLVGDGLILLGTLFAAGYVVATSRLSKQIAPLPLTALQQSVGLLFTGALFAAVLALGIKRPDLNDVPALVWLLAAVSGIVQYALAFWLYMRGMRVLPLATAGLFLALTPVFGAGGAMLFLGERLSPLQLGGCFLVIGGVCYAVLRTPAGDPVPGITSGDPDAWSLPRNAVLNPSEHAGT
jgi:drug/metabolite transporter (DMT)-like permease